MQSNMYEQFGRNVGTIVLNIDIENCYFAEK